MRDEERPNMFREVNERIAEVMGAWEWQAKQGFMCECINANCTAAIGLTRAQYDEIRSAPAHFFTVAGHERPEDERVVARNDGYVVVERL